VSTDEELGKPAGHDLEEGVYTLPVLLDMKGPSQELRELLGGQLDEASRLRALDIVRSGEGIRETIDRARGFARTGHAALADLPPSPGIVGLNAAADHLRASGEAAAA
jgi:heptaprenyl diphosphate synthase